MKKWNKGVRLERFFYIRFFLISSKVYKTLLIYETFIMSVLFGVLL